MVVRTDGAERPRNLFYVADVMFRPDYVSVVSAPDELMLKLSKAEDDSEQLYKTHTRLEDGIHCCPDCGTKAGCCGCFVWRRRTC